MDICGRSDINRNFRWIVNQNLISDDLSLQSGLAKFLCNIFGISLVFRRSGDVRSRGQNSQVFLGQLGIRYRQKAGLDGALSVWMSESGKFIRRADV